MTGVHHAAIVQEHRPVIRNTLSVDELAERFKGLF
jgi:hypothetical protein